MHRQKHEREYVKQAEEERQKKIEGKNKNGNKLYGGALICNLFSA